MGQFLATGFSRLEPPRVVLPIEVELATPGDRASMLDDPAAAAAAGGKSYTFVQCDIASHNLMLKPPGSALL